MYALRNKVLESQDLSARIAELPDCVFADLFRMHVPEENVEARWDIAGLQAALKSDFPLDLPLARWLEREVDLAEDALLARILQHARSGSYEARPSLMTHRRASAAAPSVPCTVLNISTARSFLPAKW
jgi:preprotein translocase subunit SecA